MKLFDKENGYKPSKNITVRGLRKDPQQRQDVQCRERDRDSHSQMETAITNWQSKKNWPPLFSI